MFDKSAQYYDLFYEKGLGKDYAAEAESIAARLPSARTLLDVACGTGLHLQHLRDRFECSGIDLDDGMLAIARERCPDVSFEEADMVDFDLGRTFDAVICMFSSIGYMQTELRLRQAVANMAAHVVPGGTLLVETWLTPEMIIPGHVSATHVEDTDLKITRMSTMKVADGISTIDMHYLIGTPTGVEHAVETHVLGLYTYDQYRDAFEAAGLATTIEPDASAMGRGLVTGVKA